MDARNGVKLTMMCAAWLILIFASNALSFGYDSGPSQEACGRRYKSSRMLKPPCDLSIASFCTKAGTSYPWNAVRHFVRENQGLMKRMYGDQLQRSVIEAEMLSNDIEHLKDDFLDDDLYYNGDFKSRYSKDLELDNELQQNDNENENNEEKAEHLSLNSPRLLQDEESKIADVMNTKFVFPEKSVKYGDLMSNKTKQESLEIEGIKIHVNTSTTTTSTLNVKNYSSEDANVSVTDSYNATYYFYDVDDVQNSTENSTEKTTTVGGTDGTTDTTLNYEDTTTEPEKKKTSTSTILFQDANQKKIYNFKGQGVNACPVKQEVVAPYWANNTRGQVLALINIYPFEQYIHCEICTFQHRQMYCREGCRCEQQYRIHRLLAYDPNNECRGVFADWFKFPSCCVCKCYFFSEGRVTARSPRSKEDKYVPNWFKKKSKDYYND